MSGDPYIDLAQTFDRHVERKTRKVMAPHLDEFAEVTKVGPPVELALQDSGITLPEDQVYWSPHCPAATLKKEDIVIVVAINNEFYVVGQATHGQYARKSLPEVTGATVTSKQLAEALASIGLIKVI